MRTKPLRISWSSLLAWESCMQRSYLLRQRKRSPVSNIRGFFHGTVVDRVSRDWLNQPEQESGWMARMVPQILEREEVTARESGDGIVRWKSPSDKQDVLDFCVELVDKLEPILLRLVIPFDYQVDYRFTVPVTIPGLDGEPAEIHLVGAMDYITRDDKDEWAVWDLKATRNETYWRKTLAQLTFYNIAMHGKFGSFPTRSGLIQPMCSQQVMETTVTDVERSDLMGRVISMAQSIWRDERDTCTNRSECTFCPVKHACPTFTSGFAGDDQFGKDQS